MLILRAPEGRFDLLRPGATLISMLHFPTRPASRPAAARARHGRDQPRLDRGRPGPAAGRELPCGRVERVGRGVRRAGAGPTRRSPTRAADRSASRSWARGRSASMPWRPRRSTAALERDAGCPAAGLPGVEVVTIGRNLTGHADVPPRPSGGHGRPRRRDAAPRPVACRSCRTPGSRVLPRHAVDLRPGGGPVHPGRRPADGQRPSKGSRRATWTGSRSRPTTREWDRTVPGGGRLLRAQDGGVAATRGRACGPRECMELLRRSARPAPARR